MKRESLNECSVFFLWTKEHVRLGNRLSRNSTLFPSRRSAKGPVLKFNRAAKFLKTFQVHFLFYDQENGGRGNLGILFVLNFAISRDSILRSFIFAISMGENDKRSLNFAKALST